MQKSTQVIVIGKPMIERLQDELHHVENKQEIAAKLGANII